MDAKEEIDRLLDLNKQAIDLLRNEVECAQRRKDLFVAHLERKIKIQADLLARRVMAA